jgi:DNA-binding response OmpR family regulator
VDEHVLNLRKKIESDPKKPNYILTVFGVGYKVNEEVHV